LLVAKVGRGCEDEVPEYILEYLKGHRESGISVFDRVMEYFDA
jgi:hypothetical protein